MSDSNLAYHFLFDSNETFLRFRNFVLNSADDLDIDTWVQTRTNEQYIEFNIFANIALTLCCKADIEEFSHIYLLHAYIYKKLNNLPFIG